MDNFIQKIATTLEGKSLEGCRLIQPYTVDLIILQTGCIEFTLTG